MEPRRQSYRERYFEDYRPEKKVTDSGRTVVDYIYVGTWYRWGMEGFSFPKRRLTYIGLELISLALFFAASLRNTPFNSYPLVAGFSILSMVAYALELWGVVSFSFSKTYITELDYKTIDFRITMGAFIRDILLFVALVCGLVKGLREGMTAADWLAAGGTFLSGLVSGAVIRLQTTQGYRTYRNENGEVGEEN